MTIAYLDWTDYSVFVLMLLVSALIGIYFGCFGSKQKTVDDYVLGGKSMNNIPVAFSLIASSISGITLIGVPSEIYTEKATFWILVPTHFFACLIANYVFLPIFFELKVTSINEYLELRFNRTVRSLTSAFYNATYLLFLPSVIYVPSLCLNQVTGINLHLITIGITCVCVFYTMIGGLKAVIWTDFFQIVVTILACFLIIIIGTYQVGGVTNVLHKAYADGKLNIFDLDFNPFQRTTFWTIFLGSLSNWSMIVGFGQANVQRFRSLKSPQDSHLVMFIYWLGFGLLTTLSVYGGLLLYTTYYGCDPIEQKLVSRADQIFPYFVLDRIGHIPTLPGLFIAGVFSAALSTLSTGLNAIAGTIYEDYIKRFRKNDKHAHIIMKGIVLFVGITSILFVFLIEKMGKILSMSYMITSIMSTPVSVLFCSGLLIPWANSKGAIAGAFSSMLFLAWITIGSSVSKVNFLSTSVYPIDTCDYLNKTLEEISSLNSTQIHDRNEGDDVFFLYKLSYMLYKLSGLIVGLTVGIIVSFLTGATNASKVDPMLICPLLRRFLPKRKHENIEENIMLNVESDVNKN